MGTEDWVEKRRRRGRIQATSLAVVALLVIGGWFFWTGSKKAAAEAQSARLEGLLARADMESLQTAAKEATAAYDATPTAPVSLLSVDVRAQLLLYALYTGDDARRGKGKDSLRTGTDRAAQDPSVLLAKAVYEAIAGGPDAAIEILDGGALGNDRADWQAIARAEAMLRKGDLEGAASALQGLGSPVARTWAMRVAWRRGDVEAAETAARAILAQVPEHRYAQVMADLAGARRSPDEATLQRLGALLETGEPLPALGAALVTIELSRLIRRSGDVQRADALLEQFLAADEGSMPLQEEYARVQRFQGLFGAARIRADKALRARPDDPGLLAELAEAAFFDDAAEMIKDRVGQVPAGAEDSDGAVRARAVGALVEGNPFVAADGFRATRHVGMPGEAELWLAEALLRSDDPEGARQEATRAVELLLAASGEGTREVAVARMYEGLAMATQAARSDVPEEREAGIQAGLAIMEAAFVKPNQTPWGAWLFGRFHEISGNPAGAKDAYLLACHNGQDFALACYDLARIYDSLPASGIFSRTQKEARESYLRTSPHGWHAQEVRGALGR